MLPARPRALVQRTCEPPHTIGAARSAASVDRGAFELTLLRARDVDARVGLAALRRLAAVVEEAEACRVAARVGRRVDAHIGGGVAGLGRRVSGGRALGADVPRAGRLARRRNLAAPRGARVGASRADRGPATSAARRPFERRRPSRATACAAGGTAIPLAARLAGASRAPVAARQARARAGSRWLRGRAGGTLGIACGALGEGRSVSRGVRRSRSLRSTPGGCKNGDEEQGAV